MAGDKDVIKFDSFLNEKIKSDGMHFAFSLVAYIGKSYMNAAPRSEGHVAVSIENIAIALKALGSCSKGEAKRGAKRRAHSNEVDEENCKSLDFYTRRASLSKYRNYSHPSS